MKKKNDGVKAVGRVSAVIAMVVLILAAIPVGACISLSRERNNVTAEYYGSDDVYGRFGSGLDDGFRSIESGDDRGKIQRDGFDACRCRAHGAERGEKRPSARQTSMRL